MPFNSSAKMKASSPKSVSRAGTFAADVAGTGAGSGQSNRCTPSPPSPGGGTAPSDALPAPIPAPTYGDNPIVVSFAPSLPTPSPPSPGGGTGLSQGGLAQPRAWLGGGVSFTAKSHHTGPRRSSPS